MRARLIQMIALVAAMSVPTGSARAQYMYLISDVNEANCPGHVLQPNGTPTTVEVYLVTDLNRDGSPAVCNSNASTSLNLFSYVINLAAVGGTVTYSNVTNQLPFGAAFGQLNSDGIHYKAGFGGADIGSGGPILLCSLTITGVTGNPRIEIVDQIPGSPDFTSFGTHCGGFAFDNTYKLDGPSSRAYQGAGDWGDADGLGPSAAGAVAGHVFANCQTANTPLQGVRVDAFEVGSGDLAGTGLTGADGAYAIEGLPSGDYVATIVTPLGYTTATSELPITIQTCQTTRADFNLTCITMASSPRTIGFWKHNVGIATGGRGDAQVDGATLCTYLDLIEGHFNDSAANEVAVYIPPVSGLCSDKLLAAKSLLNLSGSQTMIARARQQLLALLLNVAAGYISLAEVISVDGATVSQAITYCDNVLDDSAGNYEVAKTIADTINNGGLVAAGVIPLSTAKIAYRRGMEARSFRVTLNPGSAGREFRFVTAARGPVSLALYNVSGQLIAQIHRGDMGAGAHSVRWEGTTSSGDPVARGLYFARLQTPRETATIKVLQLSRN